MKILNKIKTILLAITLFFIAVNTTQAQGLIDSGLADKIKFFGDKAAQSATYKTTDPNAQFETLVSNIILGLLSFTGVIFFIFVIYSGLQWLTAAGNEEKIKKAKNRIVQSSIGLLVTFGAFIITALFFYPIYNKLLTEPGKSPANPYLSGGEPGNKILCDNDNQCSGTRHYCDVTNHNCVECIKGDATKKCSNNSEICTDWGTCSAAQSGDCTGLSENTCTQRSDCQIKYDFGTRPGTWVASCVNKSDYQCSPACSGDTKYCDATGTSARCIQCRTNSDCPSLVTSYCTEAGICFSF